MNLILLALGYTPAIIKIEDREAYLRALDTADAGELRPFVSLVEQEVIETLRLTLDVVEGRQAFTLDDLDRVVSNLGQSATAVAAELGRAAVRLDQVREQTRNQIHAVIEMLVARHVQMQQEKQLPFRIQAGEYAEVVNFQHPKTSSEALVQSRSGVQLVGEGRATPYGSVIFAIALQTYTAKVWGAYGVSALDAMERETWDESVMLLTEGPTSTIYFEDWQREEIENFVIRTLAQFYRAVDAEIAKRREAIASSQGIDSRGPTPA